jgi:hypothetical protein
METIFTPPNRGRSDIGHSRKEIHPFIHAVENCRRRSRDLAPEPLECIAARVAAKSNEIIPSCGSAF